MEGCVYIYFYLPHLLSSSWTGLSTTLSSMFSLSYLLLASFTFLLCLNFSFVLCNIFKGHGSKCKFQNPYLWNVPGPGSWARTSSSQAKVTTWLECMGPPSVWRTFLQTYLLSPSSLPFPVGKSWQENRLRSPVLPHSLLSNSHMFLFGKGIRYGEDTV